MKYYPSDFVSHKPTHIDAERCLLFWVSRQNDAFMVFAGGRGGKEIQIQNTLEYKYKKMHLWFL